MLPLKFKAINKVTGQEYDMSDLLIRKDLELSFNNGSMESKDPDIVFSQYTGKRDVNKIEIYTLDLISVGPFICTISDSYKQKKTMSVIDTVYGEYICDFYDSRLAYRVIGNRFESLDSVTLKHKQVITNLSKYIYVSINNEELC